MLKHLLKIILLALLTSPFIIYSQNTDEKIYYSNDFLERKLHNKYHDIHSPDLIGLFDSIYFLQENKENTIEISSFNVYTDKKLETKIFQKSNSNFWKAKRRTLINLKGKKYLIFSILEKQAKER